MKRVVILNPVAKQGRAKTLCSFLEAESTIGWSVTTGPNDATMKAAEALQEGVQIVIAAGGDGTINEVLNGLVGTDAILGILPLGSVNVLARQLGIPLHCEGAWKVIEEGFVQSVDLVKVDYHFEHKPQSRYFVQLAGIGIDAQVVEDVTAAQKKRWGPLSYVFGFLKSLCRTLPELSVRVDGGLVVKGVSVLVGNGNYYGGPFRVFRKASMTDGFMDVYVTRALGYGRFLFYFVAMMTGFLEKVKGITFYQTPEIGVTSTQKVAIEIDGEFIGYLPAKLTVLPRALKILVPEKKGTPFVSSRTKERETFRGEGS